MDLQQFGEVKKPEAHLENLEMRAQKPEDAAKETLRLADRMLTDEKSRLEALKMALDAQAPERAQIQILEDEVDAAWEDLSTEVKAAVAEKPIQAPVSEEELDWAFADESVPEKASAESIQTTDALSAKEVAPEEELDWEIPEEKKILEKDPARISELLGTDDADIEHLGFSIEALSSEHKKILFQKLSDDIGSQFAQRFIDSPEYRTQLLQFSQALSESLPNGAVLLKERSVKNLAVLLETVGPEAPAIARAMDLSSYLPGLDRHERDTVFSVTQSSFDEEGKIDHSKVIFEQQIGRAHV